MYKKNRFARQYGPIYQLNIFGEKLIMLNHSQLFDEVIVKHQLTDRPPISLMKFNVFLTHPTGGALPFANLSGHEWKHRRRLAASKLTNIPTKTLIKLTNQSLANSKTGLLPLLDERLKTDNSNTFFWDDMKTDLMWLAFNTIYCYNVGIPIDKNDVFWSDLCQAINLTFSWADQATTLNNFPILKHTPYAKKFYNLINRRTKMFETLIDRRQECKMNNVEVVVDDHNETYIDYMLKCEKEGKLSHNQVLADIGALFSAGTDTTASTLSIGIGLFCKYPNMQDKFRNIILKLWQINGKPMLGNFKQFNIEWIGVRNNHTDDEYNKLVTQFKAFYYEILRISSVATTGLAHYNSGQDISVNVKSEYGTVDGKDHSYVIPSNAIVLYNSEYMHRHSKYETKYKHSNFGFNDYDTDKFCLENWINNDENNYTQKKYHNMPIFAFGKGARNCVGMRLAEYQVQIFIASLILNLKFEFNDIQDKKNPNEVQFNYIRAIGKKLESIAVNVQRI